MTCSIHTHLHTCSVCRLLMCRKSFTSFCLRNVSSYSGLVEGSLTCEDVTVVLKWEDVQ